MKKALLWLDKNIEVVICSVLLCMVACLMMLQVFCRYVLNNALSWPEELASYIHIWYAMLGISYASKYGLHLRVDTVVNLLPKKIRAALNLVADISLLVFFLLMIKAGVGVVSKMAAANQVSAAMRIPMWIVYLSLLVGCVLATVRLIQKWYGDFCALRNSKKGENA